jgi:hypothetical protein
MKNRPRMADILRPTQTSSRKTKGEGKVDPLRMLLHAALSLPISSPTTSSPGSSKENYMRQINGGEDLTEKELRQLRAVKRLMEVKGYEAMMKFLDS